MTSLRPLSIVVVADDFSESSAAALSRAALLPLAARAELHLVHVVDGATSEGAAERTASAARELLAERSSSVAAAVKQASPGSEVSIGTHVVRGQAFVEIIRKARALQAELIVFGRHRPRRVRDSFVNSTAERVVRKGDVPVLLVAKPPSGAYQRVVAAVDLGDTSRRVLDLAVTLAPGNRTLTLVNAYQVAFETVFERSIGHETMEEIRRDRRTESAAAAAQLREALQPLGVDCELVVREGDPRFVITREALRQRAELVVLGTHARSGIAHALLGSVAEWMVRAAPCDIAVTRPARFTFELP